MKIFNHYLLYKKQRCSSSLKIRITDNTDGNWFMNLFIESIINSNVEAIN